MIYNKKSCKAFLFTNIEKPGTQIISFPREQKVLRLWRRQYDPGIVEKTVGLILCPSTPICRLFLKHCTLIKANMNNYIQLQTAAIFLSIEPLSKTGYWLGVCHGWFHSQGLTGGVKNASWVRITKLKSLPHSGIRTRDLPLTKRARYHWATKADINRVGKSSPGFYLRYF